MDFSIIIPAYNEEFYLPTTIKSLRDGMDLLSDHKGEIIVVDNNSTDSTNRLSHELADKVVFAKTRGIAFSRNAGAYESLGEYIFFVDADTQVHPNTLLEALNAMQSGKVGAGGANLKFVQTHGKWLCGVAMPNIWNWISRTFRLAAGSFIFCTRRLFVESGGFSEKIYAGEEIYFSQSVKKLCRKQNKDFLILRENPVVTSSRKLEWFSSTRIMLNLFLLLFFPLAIRFRSLCGFWYERPEGSDPQGS